MEDPDPDVEDVVKKLLLLSPEEKRMVLRFEDGETVKKLLRGLDLSLPYNQRHIEILLALMQDGRPISEGTEWRSSIFIVSKMETFSTRKLIPTMFALIDLFETHPNRHDRIENIFHLIQDRSSIVLAYELLACYKLHQTVEEEEDAEYVYFRLSEIENGKQEWDEMSYGQKTRSAWKWRQKKVQGKNLSVLVDHFGAAMILLLTVKNDRILGLYNHIPVSQWNSSIPKALLHLLQVHPQHSIFKRTMELISPVVEELMCRKTTAQDCRTKITKLVESEELSDVLEML